MSAIQYKERNTSKITKISKPLSINMITGASRFLMQLHTSTYIMWERNIKAEEAKV